MIWKEGGLRWVLLSHPALVWPSGVHKARFKRSKVREWGEVGFVRKNCVNGGASQIVSRRFRVSDPFLVVFHHVEKKRLKEAKFSSRQTSLLTYAMGKAGSQDRDRLIGWEDV